MVQAATFHTEGQQDDQTPTHAQDVSCLAMGLRSIQTVLELNLVGAGALSNLTRLCLHANSISSLDGLDILTSLRELLVSCNPLSTTGQSLSTLVNLRVFDATSCRLHNADGFACLTNLQHLVRAYGHMLYDWYDA
jgi:Leucine-rich repeat (LRR) protein